MYWILFSAKNKSKKVLKITQYNTDVGETKDNFGIQIPKFTRENKSLYSHFCSLNFPWHIFKIRSQGLTNTFFLLLKLCFLELFWFIANQGGRYRDFSYTHSPYTGTASHLSTFPIRWIRVTINEPTLTHHNRSKSTVYIMVHSWCYTFYGFRQMYSDMYP